MPHINVWVDADDVMDDLSDDDLREELHRRAKKKGGSPFNADYMIPPGVAKMTLDDAAQIFRKMERYDLAFKLDEIRIDYLNG